MTAGEEVRGIPCVRCSRENVEPLQRPPFRNELGDRIQATVCAACWAAWLKHQTLLINHYGLDPREKKSKDFLYGQIEDVLLGGGTGTDPAGGEAPTWRIPED